MGPKTEKDFTKGYVQITSVARGYNIHLQRWSGLTSNLNRWLGHLSPCDGIYACADWTSVYTLTQNSLLGMESEPMLTPRQKSPLSSTTMLKYAIELCQIIKIGQIAVLCDLSDTQHTDKLLCCVIFLTPSIQTNCCVV